MFSQLRDFIPNNSENINLDSLLLSINIDWQWKEQTSNNIVPLSHFIKDEKFLLDLAIDIKKEVRAPTLKVAASLLQKQWLNKIISLVVAVFNLSGIKPQQCLDFLIVDLNDKEWGWIDSPYQKQGRDFHDWLNSLLISLCSTFKQVFNLPPRIFWGNAALAVASPWSQISLKSERGSDLAEDARFFFSYLCIELQDAIEWLSSNKLLGLLKRNLKMTFNGF